MQKAILSLIFGGLMFSLCCSFTIDPTNPTTSKNRKSELYMLGFEIFRPNDSPLNHTDIKIEIYDHTEGKTVLTRDYSEMRTNKFSSINYFENMEYGHDLTLLIQAPNYFAKEINIAFTPTSNNETILQVIGLDRPPYDINGEYADRFVFPVMLDSIEVGTEMVIPDIYYAYNSDKLELGSLWVLDSVSRIIANNPQLKIELGGHADARGGDKYNFELSQRRVKRVKDYLVQQVGNSVNNRITATGFGETQLLNHCGNGVLCGENQHQENRRTTFKVVDDEANKVLISLEEKMRLRRSLAVTTTLNWF